MPQAMALEKDIVSSAYVWMVLFRQLARLVIGVGGSRHHIKALFALEWPIRLGSKREASEESNMQVFAKETEGCSESFLMLGFLQRLLKIERVHKKPKLQFQAILACNLRLPFPYRLPWECGNSVATDNQTSCLRG